MRYVVLSSLAWYAIVGASAFFYGPVSAEAATCKTSVSVVTNEKGRIVGRVKTRTCYNR